MCELYTDRFHKSTLHCAIVARDLDKCERLLNNGQPADAVDENNNTALAIAAEHGYLGGVLLLIKHCSNLNTRNNQGDTPLLLAIKHENIDVATLLIESGCDLDTRGSQGQTALHLSVVGFHLKLVKLLISKQCNLNALDNNLYTPLMQAVLCNDVEITKRLLKAGANLNCGDKQGCTALYHASTNGYTQCVEELILHKCDLNLPKKGHDTPLIATIKMGHFDTAVSLVKAGCDVNKRGHLSATAMHSALNKMHETSEPMVKYGLIPNTEGSELMLALIDAGCDTEVTDNNDGTPLMFAARHALLEMCLLLTRKGSSIEARTRSGDTTLHMAIAGKHPAIVELCLKSRINVNAVNTNNETALYQAVATWVDKKLITMLVEAGCNVNIAETINGCTALHRSLEQKRAEISIILIEHGGDIYIENYKRENSIYLACLNGIESVLSHITQRSQFTAETNRLSRLPLHAAVTGQHYSVVKLLSEQDADFNQIDSNGQSVIQIACEDNSTELLKLLLNLGADPDAHRYVKFRRCCVSASDHHPHFHLEPLVIAVKHQNLDMLSELLNAYYDTPRTTIKTLIRILSENLEIRSHYSCDIRENLSKMMFANLCIVQSLQKLCVTKVWLKVGENGTRKINQLNLPITITNILRRKRLLC